MDRTPNVTWNQKLWDVISHLYWAPRFVGLASISEDKYSAGFNPKALKLLGEGYRLYGRNLKIDAFLKYLSGQEEVLNFFFNIAFAIAPDDIISRLLCTPLDIRDEGPFESFGGEQLAARYEFGKENVTQPDGFFATRIKGDIKRLHLAAVSWTWLRDEISKIERELDPEARGDQTLKRLLAGLRAQIEAHGNTGIVKAGSATP